MEEQTQTPVPPVEPAGDVPQEQRTFGMLCHIAALAGYIIPFGNILGPLVMWLLKKNEMPFVDEQGKEAINFQITVFIAVIICIPLLFIIIGFLLLPVVAIGSLVFMIIAAIKANGGEHYRYPLSIRFIK